MNNTVQAAGTEILRALNDRDWAGVGRICRPDYLHHAPGVPEANVDEYIATLQIAVSAVPDMQIELQQIVTTGEYAMLRYTVHGTHTGDFHGIPPTGVPIALNVLRMVRVKDGLLAEGWYQFDARQLMHPSAAS